MFSSKLLQENRRGNYPLTLKRSLAGGRVVVFLMRTAAAAAGSKQGRERKGARLSS